MRAVLAAALLLTTASAASAADLTVRFTGRFQSGTCELGVNDVDLGVRAATYFNSNTQSPQQEFQLTRSKCAADIRVLHVRLVGTASAADSRYFAVPTTGGVSGLAVWIQTPSNQTLAPNQVGFDWSTAGTVSGTQPLYARLVRTGTVTAGTLSVPVTVQVTYN